MASQVGDVGFDASEEWSKCDEGASDDEASALDSVRHGDVDQRICHRRFY